MRSIAPWLPAFSFLPRVEDPWPDTVGFWLPISTAGAGVVLAGAAFITATRERREDAIRLGGFWGFVLGVVFYFVALAAQVVSAL